jgi:hypothetical protein
MNLKIKKINSILLDLRYVYNKSKIVFSLYNLTF